MEQTLTRMNGHKSGAILKVAPQLDLRKLSLEDVDVVVRNTKEFCAIHPFYKTIPFDEAKLKWFLETNIDKSDFFSWLVFEGNTPIAGMGAMVMYYAMSQQKYSTDLFQFIKPEHRSGKAFQLLIGLYTTWAKQMGLHNAQLSYTGDKTDAFDRIIRRWNYKRFGTLYTYQFDLASS